jgi:hypothetical protein
VTGIGGIVDVAIGMSFVYLLLSLVCSGLNELWAWVFRLRAATLRDGIVSLLADPELEVLGDRIYAHPLIRSLTQQGGMGKLFNRAPLPSYIPSKTFVLALLDTLGDPGFGANPGRVLAAVTASLDKVPGDAKGASDLEALKNELTGKATLSADEGRKIADRIRAIANKLPDGESKKILLGLWQRADSIQGVRALLETMPDTGLRRQLELFLDEGSNDVAAYRQQLETWFDQGMERLSGVYKRRAQIISVVFGISIAFAVGVDSWGVANALMRDGALRQATLAAATEAVKNPPPSPAPGDTAATEASAPDAAEAIQQIATTLDTIDQLKLPVGWDYLCKGAKTAKAGPSLLERWYWPWRILGMVFTGLAVALGAPFWFDVLSKLINLRSTGPAPSKAPAK